MATFLVTPRMNPALRARVERAVSGKTRARHNAAALGLKNTAFAGGKGLRFMRVLPIVALLLVGGLVAGAVVTERRALEADRSALVQEIEKLREGLPAGHEGLVAETERWLVEAGAEGETSELVDGTLRPSGALDAALRRPALYVRGAAAALRDERTMDGAIRESDKDAFLVCLMHPPASTSERDLLAKVKGVYFAGAKVDDETINVRRLAEVRRGLAVLAPSFEDSIRATGDRNALKRLRKELDKAPVAAAKKAVGAEILIVAAESQSGTRVMLVDLKTKKPLLRVSRRAATQAWSPQAFVHTQELEACSVAVAVRRAVAE